MLDKLSKVSASAIATVWLSVGSANADLKAEFDEGAPKDRFTFTNIGSCDIIDAKLVLDLSGSKSGLIFDVSDSGSGVQVFQPFDLVAGKESVVKLPTVSDGDKKIELDISKLVPNRSVAFTIDVDDTIGNREITVSDDELSGATVTLVQAGRNSSSTFQASPRTTLKLRSC
ncbi:MAG: aggregation factor core [Pseudomonadota bacterium]